MMIIEAIFKFIASNPPSIAIAGAILMWLAGSIMKPLGYGGGDLLTWAPFVFVGGLVLQILWLFFVRRG